MSATRVIIPEPLTDTALAICPLVDFFRNVHESTLVLNMERNSKLSDDTHTMLSAYTGWDEVGGVYDVHKYTYTHAQMDVCTTVTINSFLSIQHHTETEAKQVNMELGNYGPAHARVTARRELNSKDVPDVVLPTHVRIEKVKTYTKGPWVFRLLTTWSGKSRTEVELAQSKGHNTYAIQIELVPTHGYWDAQEHTHKYVAASMLMKINSILSDEPVHARLVS